MKNLSRQRKGKTLTYSSDGSVSARVPSRSRCVSLLNKAMTSGLENGKLTIQTMKTGDFDEEHQDLHGTTDDMAAGSSIDDSERRGSSIQRVV